MTDYARISGQNILPGVTSTSQTARGGALNPMGALGGAALGSLIPYAAPATGIFSAGGALSMVNPYVAGAAIVGGLLT